MESVGKCSAETLGIDKLRTLLVTSAKESAFRKVVQATMVRDRQHGPVIELNRISVKKQAAANSSANNGGKVVPASSTGGCKPVFAQMVGKVHLLGPESLLLPHRVWKVSLVRHKGSLKILRCQNLGLSLCIAHPIWDSLHHHTT